MQRKQSLQGPEAFIDGRAGDDLRRRLIVGERTVGLAQKFGIDRSTVCRYQIRGSKIVGRERQVDMRVLAETAAEMIEGEIVDGGPLDEKPDCGEFL